MPIFPEKKFEFQVNLNQDEALEKLYNSIADFWSLRDKRYFFRGKIQGNKFVLDTINFGKNFLPTLKGEIVSKTSGCVIKAKISYAIGIKILLSLVFILMAPLFLASILNFHAYPKSLLLSPLFLFFLMVFYFTSIYHFKNECVCMEASLRDIFAEHSD